ncbi:MAG: hypothetical protein C4525_15115 [Desulfarculus sp.]|nr:MAG: hypothetical protein C4525_15115 [Desulfarculus sp.]
MLSNRELHRLASLDTHPHYTLSLYLSLDQTREQRLLALGDLIKRKEHKLAGNGSAQIWHDLAQDVEQAVRYVEELPASPGRSLALFSCAPMDLFETHSLLLPVGNLLELGPAPYIRPLAALSSDHGHTLAVLLDKKRARFFDCFLGLAQEMAEAEIFNETGAQMEGGGQGRTGDSHVSRRAGQAQGRHYKETAAAARELMTGRGCQWLVIGGPRAAVEGLQEALHPYQTERLVGSFSLEAGASEAQVAQAVTQLQQDAGRRRQEELLGTLANNLGPGGQAATGLNQVLGALFEGRVHTLFLRRGLVQPGGACHACGRLRHVAGPCPICRQEMTPVDDVVNLALARAINSGAAVEQISGDSELDRLGGVAALLRYA